jgi:hypothetical protein
VIEADGLRKSLDRRSRLTLGDVTAPAFLKQSTETRMVTLQGAETFQSLWNPIQKSLRNGGEKKGVPVLWVCSEQGLGSSQQFGKALLT